MCLTCIASLKIAQKFKSLNSQHVQSHNFARMIENIIMHTLLTCFCDNQN